MSRNLQRPWRIMPLIQSVEGVRLPRAQSYTQERDAGRVVVALEWPRFRIKRLADGLPRRFIFIRNAHLCSVTRDGVEVDDIRIENMREFDGCWNRLRVHETGQTGAYVPATKFRNRSSSSLATLQGRGWKLVGTPMLLAEPMHNCIIQMDYLMWENLLASHQVTARGCMEANASQDEDETPLSELIQIHYKALKVNTWTSDRIKRLCAMWSLTLRELSRLIQCPPGSLEDMVAGKTLPLHGSVALWLLHMERLGESNFLGKKHDTPLFPNLKP